MLTINSIVSSPREAATAFDAASPDDLAIIEPAFLVSSPDTAVDEGEEDGEPVPTGADAEALGAFALADELASLIARGAPHPGVEARATVAALPLRRSFLIGLSDAAADDSVEGRNYARAIRALLVPRDRMVRANLRLVISMAKKHLYSGVPMDDLIQDGNIGLMNAVDKFDWRRGFRFSTMATWWIRQQITRSIADSSLAIRLPVHVFEIAQRFPREADAFEKRTGRPPTILQLAELVQQDAKKIESLVRACSTPLLIDSLHDELIVDLPGDPELSERISASNLRRTLDELLGELGARPEKIVRLRFGIGIDEPQTLEEIGALFDVTRERIRQIESKALTKLKHPTRLARLSSWSPDPDAHELANSSSRNDDADTEATKPLPPPAQRKTTTPTQSSRAAKAGRGERLTPLERVMLEATNLNVPVKQSKRGVETTTWVSLTKAIDNRHRKLIRSLLALGFEYWPGKGYWR